MYVLKTIPINLYGCFLHSGISSNIDILFFTISTALFSSASFSSFFSSSDFTGSVPNSFWYISSKLNFEFGLLSSSLSSVS